MTAPTPHFLRMTHDNAMLGVGLWGALYAAYLITLRACHATACRAPLEQQR